MITNIIDLMRALDYVQGSPSLTQDQKRLIAGELKYSLPAKALCHGAHHTHDIANSLFDKATETMRTDGPAVTTTAASGRKEDAHQAREEPLQGAGRPQGKDVFPRNARKAHGGAKALV